MIIKNEEKVLARCIDSCKDAVDEVIVVDTGSTDRSVQIALDKGARVYHMTWENDFAKARNYAIDYAKSKWILILDADEAIAKGEAILLRNHIEKNPGFDAFFLQCISYFGLEKKRLGSSVNPSVRVFRNLPGYRYKGRIHEQIADPILKSNPNASLQFTDIKIEHDGYLLEVVVDKKKSERNIQILEKELQDTQDECFHRYNLAVEYIRIRDYERALEEIGKAKKAVNLKQISYGHIVLKREIDSLEHLGRIEEAIVACSKAITDYPDYPDLYLSQGIFHLGRKEWQQAEACFLRALEIGEAPVHYSSNQGSGSYYPSFFLGKIYEQMGRYDLAIAYYLSTLQFKPNSLPPFLRLVSLIARDVSSSEEMIQRLEDLFHIQSAKTWWSSALSFYQLGLFHEVMQVLDKYPVPEEKEREKVWLQLRCKLLISSHDETMTFMEQQILLEPSRRTRLEFYLSLKENDAEKAKRVLEVIRKESDPWLLNLYEFIIHEDGGFTIPLELISTLTNGIWSELNFLYHLAEKEFQPELKIRIASYWRTLINCVPDGRQKVEGRFAYIKALNVRIHQLLLKAGENFQYQAPWEEVRSRLLTLIDELFMGEIV